jgi:hypothetical protein
MAAFVNHLSAGVVRKDPLGPATLNQLHANISDCIDPLVRREHFSDGQHNALEIPWVLGHVDSGTTGYLFDTAYGGGTIARPAAGRATISVISGVIGNIYAPGSVFTPAASVIANPSGTDIDSTPQLVEVEVVSATSIEVRLWRMTSALGSPGNTWSLHTEGFDVAVHSLKQPVEASLLGSHLTKVRRDFLTEQATDWNALVSNQGVVRKAIMLEHASTGAHLVDRVAKAQGWFRPAAGPSYSILTSHGVASVSRISAGVVEVTLDGLTLSSTSLAACFPQVQPASADELVIIAGRAHSTTTFRFYLYVYSVAENKWTRDDRPFFAAMFGRPA